MQHVTRDGLTIEVGRVDRRQLDKVAIPEPVPPSREIETWGGVTETVPMYDDVCYISALFEYRLRMWRERLDVLAEGVALPDDLGDIPARLEALGGVIPLDGAKRAYLRYLLPATDRDAIVSKILYLSTVTYRGIDEAVRRFDYRWRDKPVETWHIPTAHGARGQLAVDWRAALRSGIGWGDFCQLPGPEQSAHVAFWALEDRLAYLLQNEK